MPPSNYNPDSIPVPCHDPNPILLAEVAEALVLGAPTIVLIGGHAADSCADAMTCAAFQSLPPDQRKAFLREAMAALCELMEAEGAHEEVDRFPVGAWEALGVEVARQVPMIEAATTLEILMPDFQRHGLALEALARTHPALSECADDFAGSFGCLEACFRNVEIMAHDAAKRAGVEVRALPAKH